MTSPERPPYSGRVTLIAAAVLGLTIVAMVVDHRRERTGELIIQSDRADVRVVIRQAGRTIVPTTEKRSFTLRPGDYEIALDGPSEALRVVPARVKLARGGRAIVRVESGSR